MKDFFELRESHKTLDEAKGTGVKKFVKGMRVAKTSNSDMKGTVIKGGDNMKNAVEVEWDSGTTTLASGKYLKSIKKNESVDLGEAGSFRKKFNKAMTWSKDFTGSPKDMQDRIRSYSDDELRKLSGKRSPAGDGSARQAQIKMIDREMRRRGIKESVDLGEAKISVGDRVTLKPNKNTLDRSLIGKAGVVTGMLGSKPTVKFANGKTIAVSPNDLKINESVELDESKNISSITNVGYMDDGGGTALTVRERDAKKLQADLKKNGYEKHSAKRKSGTTMTHFIFKSKGKPDIYISFDGQDGTSYVSYNKDVFESVELGEARKDAAADLYFNTYSAAVQHAKAQAEKKGYEVDEDDWFRQVTTGKGKPGRGKTTRHTLKLTKNGKPVRQGLSIQVYNRDTDKNTYELNYYVS